MSDAGDLRMSFNVIFGMALNEALNLVLVFINAESACGINDGTAFLKAFVGRFEDRFLQRNTDLRAVVHIALNGARISSEHTLT